MKITIRKAEGLAEGSRRKPKEAEGEKVEAIESLNLMQTGHSAADIPLFPVSAELQLSLSWLNLGKGQAVLTCKAKWLKAIWS